MFGGGLGGFGGVCGFRIWVFFGAVLGLGFGLLKLKLLTVSGSSTVPGFGTGKDREFPRRFRN